VAVAAAIPARLVELRTDTDTLEGRGRAEDGTGEGQCAFVEVLPESLCRTRHQTREVRRVRAMSRIRAGSGRRVVGATMIGKTSPRDASRKPNRAGGNAREGPAVA
jgi:hypothetical protein